MAMRDFRGKHEMMRKLIWRLYRGFWAQPWKNVASFFSGSFLITLDPNNHTGSLRFTTIRAGMSRCFFALVLNLITYHFFLGPQKIFSLFWCLLRRIKYKFCLNGLILFAFSINETGPRAAKKSWRDALSPCPI